MARSTPRGFRLHVGVFGRRNVGKSSLINALTGQTVAIVSDSPGTTTDPVHKPMELQPIGPTVFIDTAGVDDVGDLGALRVERTRRVLDQADVGLVVGDAAGWGDPEWALLDELGRRGIRALAVANKSDVGRLADDARAKLAERGVALVETAATEKRGMGALREAIACAAPEESLEPPSIVSDLVGPGECAVLVVPIDKEAPKGRLILPQVQSIRDLLDGDSFCLVVKERELSVALERLAEPPKLVVTDSQSFLKVAADTPPEIPMTSFSVLFSRFRGDLVRQVEGALAIDGLRPGDRVLVAEACTHHPITEDIGRVKIPRWLTSYVGGALDIEHVAGRAFPDDLGDTSLVVHCGACMWNRRTMLTRIAACEEQGVPITNYGLAIAYSLGIFERALSPFPAALEAYRAARSEASAS